MVRRIVIVAAATLAVTLGSDAGRTTGAPVLTTPNPQVDAHFSIPSMGDLDGDGHAEIVVGAGSETVGPNTQQGRVYVFSGVTGALQRTLTTPNPQTDAVFGYRVFANADVDGDAKPDIVVSAPYETVSMNAAQGRVYAFSGVTGALLRTLTTPNPQANANFGIAVGAADTDADSKADIAVGSPGESVASNAGQGRAYVFSGANGALLHTFDTPNPEANAAFGNSLAVGNIDAGTQADVVVGASGETVNGVAEQGRAYVFAGGTWTLLRTLVSPNPQAFSGCCNVAVADIDADSRADIAMGAIHEDVTGVVGQGRVYVFSGATWGVLRTLTTANPETNLPFGFGSFISMGDVTHPGKADIAVSAQFETVGTHAGAGRAYLFSGDTGALLSTFESPAVETSGLFGYVPIGRLSDVDGDLRGDLALGAYNETAGGNAGQGRVYVNVLSDGDGDGVLDVTDNCRAVANPTQLNTDAANTALNRPGADTLGDACDDDSDGDGYTNVQETTPPLSENTLAYCDIMRADVDGDKAVSILDLAAVSQHFLQAVTPATERYSQDADAAISILDLAKMASLFLRNVNACL